VVDTTLHDITAAASDPELLERMISAAAEAGIRDPQGWATMNARRIVASALPNGGGTVASAYAYAQATYAPMPSPGSNPAAVTDAYLRAAVADARAALEAPITEA
jgi:hypothetical protein